MKLIIRILINAIALWITAWLLPAMTIADSLWEILLVAVIFGLVNAFIQPIVKLFALPLTILTLGLFTFVINALMLLLTSWLTDSLTIDAGGWFMNLLVAILASIIISIISTLLSKILPDIN